MNMPFERLGVKSISPVDAIAKAKNNEALVIDVRDINELMSTGIAKGALHLPLMTFQAQATPGSPDFHKDLSQEKPVILYCASGARSGMAGQMMVDNGFKEVFNLGGLAHWYQGGGEIVPAK